MTSFEKIPSPIRLNERFQFVFAADFPNQYDRRAIEALQSIANTGTVAGVYLFIHFNQDNQLPRDISLDGFKNPFYIDLKDGTMPATRKLVLKPDSSPSPELQGRLFEVLHKAKPPERMLDWDSIVGIEENQWWNISATEIIETPIGTRGSGENLKLWFGVNPDGQSCAHGMLGAMTGAGKSNLYHVLITGLTTRYSPEELRLYLIDGKDGVEFQPYRHLPHAEVVSLRSSAELSRSVLAELIDEKERRNKLFVRVGVTDLISYRRKGQPEGKLPRMLLLVDEYQQLFEGDKDGIASNYLLQLAQQGRSAGIHMFLASQRFGAAGMLNQNAIFGNLHLRVAMQMTSSDVQALTEFGRRGKALIATCDLPGKIVVNDRNGEDNANQAGKVVFLKSERRDQLLQDIIQKAGTLSDDSLPRRVVFNGQAQPSLIDNPQLSVLLRHATWPTGEEFEALARKPSYAGGLDVADWFSVEHPHIVWLGQEFSVRGQAAMIFRRRTSENALVVGGANAARYGMLASILAGLSLNSPTANQRFIIVDRSIPGSQWSETLQQVADCVLQPAGFSTKFTKESSELEGIFNDLLAEIEKRRALSEQDLTKQPSIFVTLTELDRIEALRRKPGSYGLSDSPMGEKLARLYTESAPLGIHMILSFSGVGPMANVIDERRGLLNFRHRVALQMSEDDSHRLVRSRKAAILQSDGPVPVCALYLDVENDRSVRFKPYSTEPSSPAPEDSLLEQLRNIGGTLSQRSNSK